MNDLLNNVKKVHYTDIHGNKQTVEFFEEVPGLIPWKRGEEPSPAKRYKMEDGSIIQIPDNAWALLEEIVIEYNDGQTEDDKVE